MVPTTSVRRFDEQFARQLREGDLRLNPFEATALPYLPGRVLDWTIVLHESSEYPGSGDTIKSFETIVARKPGSRERPPAPDAESQHCS